MQLATNRDCLSAHVTVHIELSGQVSLFQQDDAGKWSWMGRLYQYPAEAYDRYGAKLAMANDVLLVGAPDAFAKLPYASPPFWRQGRAFVHEQLNGDWASVPQKELIPDDYRAAQGFGSAVDISGNLAIVGASGDNGGRGAAHLFERQDSGDWQQIAKFVDDGQFPRRLFGNDVAIGHDFAVVGAPFEGTLSPSSAYGSGAAYIFAPGGDGKWSLLQKLTGGTAGAAFGFSVEIDGENILVGEAGHSYLFSRRDQNEWTRQHTFMPYPFTNNTALDGQTVVYGVPSWELALVTTFGVPEPCLFGQASVALIVAAAIGRRLTR
jgi:FG-GAP repeat